MSQKNGREVGCYSWKGTEWLGDIPNMGSERVRSSSAKFEACTVKDGAKFVVCLPDAVAGSIIALG